MIVLYLALVLFLGLTKWLISWRASALERKYAQIAAAAKTMSHRPQYRAGTSNKPRDPYLFAKNQYELGRLVEKRDRIEEKYTLWQARADKVSTALDGIRSVKGRYVPYALGVVDLVITAMLLDHFGIVSNLSVQALKDLLASWF